MVLCNYLFCWWHFEQHCCYFFSVHCGNGVLLLKCRRNKGLHFALQSLHKASVIMSRGSIAEVETFKILDVESINIVQSNHSFLQSTAVCLLDGE